MLFKTGTVTQRFTFVWEDFQTRVEKRQIISYVFHIFLLNLCQNAINIEIEMKDLNRVKVIPAERKRSNK